MKVISKGTGCTWKTEVLCSGFGNKGWGCGAVLEVIPEDLRWFEGTDYPVYRDSAVVMRCCECGELTDLTQKNWPPGFPGDKLKRFSKHWADTGEDKSNTQNT